MPPALIPMRYSPPRPPSSVTRRPNVPMRTFGGVGQQIAPSRPFGSIVLAEIAARKRQTGEVARQTAAEMVQWMRRTHPWQNRTGQAEARLDARVVDRGSGGNALRLALVASHGVFYGQFLEYRWGGRYAILRPAVHVFAPLLARRTQAVWRAGIAGQGGSRVSSEITAVADATSLVNPANPLAPHVLPPGVHRSARILGIARAHGGVRGVR